MDDGAAGKALPGASVGSSTDENHPALQGKSRPAVSKHHARHRADLRHVTNPEEIAQAEGLAYRLACAMRYRLSRRYRFASAGQRLDLRRTIRRNLCRGGEPLTLVHRARPDRPVRIVVMLDVSGSMQPYTRYLLQFVRGLVRSWSQTDAFLFHTRLVRISEALREKDAIHAMTRLSLMANGFGGGTRMVECLRTFNDQFAKRVLNSRSVVLILSDGYDTDEPVRFAAEMAQLKRRARRLVWLNPLLGWKRYEPVNRTMRAALPFIDHFGPAHSLDALAAVEPELRAL